MNRAAVIENARGLAKGYLGIPLLLIALLAMMTLPMPAILLDLLFTFNISLSLVILLVCVYAMRPMDFNAFPTVLLVATLLRLALNVASTRVVLLHGHEGGDAAGKVIQAFGEVVIGGNYAVGMVVFLILMIINFAVVTKGAGRVSEVSARFTLDAMPGKQMAIDADLNAGIIEQDEAKARREEIAQEANFYGSMDGASKFVKGDAVAGFLILFINIIGGLGIGMLQHDLAFGDAMEKYVLLTIGDGLVAQIPSLLLSVAAAILVTRTTERNEMSAQVVRQMFSAPKGLSIAAGILILLGLIPGMPHLAFLLLGGCAAGLSWYFWRYGVGDEEEPVSAGPAGNSARGGASSAAAGTAALGGPSSAGGQPALPAAGAHETRELGWEDVLTIDVIGLEVGYRLIPLVDKAQNGQLLGRIKGVRKKLSQELGFLMPSVHIRDNLDLLPTGYHITLMGVTIAEGDVQPDRELAINPGQVFGKIDGIPGKDPAFGLEAVWIDPSNKDQAQTLGYTVVDSSTVIATHLNTILNKHSYELIGHEEVQQWLDQLAKHSPKLAEELCPNTITISQLLKVLQELLREEVPIRDMRSIAEALVNLSPKTQDTRMMTAAARIALRRLIVQNLCPDENEMPVITLDPTLEQILLKSVQTAQAQNSGAEDVGLVLEPSLIEKLQQSLGEAAQKQEMLGKPAILLVSGPLRPVLARFVRFSIERMAVLSYQEVPDNRQITIVASVGQ